MVEEMPLHAENIHYIGFSLGGQVVHFASQWYKEIHTPEFNKDGLFVYNQIGRITTLDPASRHFESYTGAHITAEDALFVDLIHTSSVKDKGSPVDTLNGRFGMFTSVGTVDFYSNGGQKQPMCHGLKKRLTTCNHHAAIYYFVASLRDTKRISFLSVACSGWSSFSVCNRKGEADSSMIGLMGIDAPYYYGMGSQYLEYTIKKVDKTASRVSRVTVDI